MKMENVALIQWMWPSRKGLRLEYETSIVKPTDPGFPWRKSRSEYSQEVDRYNPAISRIASRKPDGKVGLGGVFWFITDEEFAALKEGEPNG